MQAKHNLLKTFALSISVIAVLFALKRISATVNIPEEAFRTIDMNNVLTAMLPKNYVPGSMKFRWRQVSGPVATIIDQPDSTKTKVREFNLPGKYLFELKVTGKSGKSDLDTVAVNVLPPLVDQVGISNLKVQVVTTVKGNANIKITKKVFFGLFTQTLVNTTRPAVVGINNIDVGLAGLPAGVYTITIKINGKTFALKLTK